MHRCLATAFGKAPCRDGVKTGLSSLSFLTLRKDIDTLMNALQEHKVYIYQEGRVTHPNDGPVPDVLSTGLTALTTAATNGVSPLSEFNAQYNRIRERENSYLCPPSLQ